MSFFGELRRRNVVKVAVAYAIVGWIVVEVSATVLPVFEAPDWIVQVFTFFVILGFPLALVLSWAYELTPEGIKLERDVAAGESITHVTGRKLDFAIIGLLLVAVVFLVVNYVLVDSEQAAVVQESITPSVEPEPEPFAPVVVEEQSAVLPNSVAVLPFDNLSPDPDNAYFAAGVHESVLNELAKIRDMSVIARTSVLRFSGGDWSIPEIAEELNVETVMEGSVRYAGNRVRITAQLIDPGTGAHLWSEEYDRDLSDIFAIQSDIATRIAMALEAELLPREQESIERPLSNSTEAYALYLRGVILAGNIQPGGIGLLTALHENLDRAIDLDPNFARAYAVKALDYSQSLFRTFPRSDPVTLPVREGLALENANRALALDPTLGAAHAALGWVHIHNRDWVGARRAFDNALELSPNDRDVLIDFSNFLAWAGDIPEAVRLAQRLVEIDPVYAPGWLGQIYRRSGDLDAAARSLNTAVSLDSTAFRWNFGLVEAIRGNNSDALREARLDEEFGERAPDDLAIRVYVYGRIGQPAEAMRVFGELEAMAAEYEIRPSIWTIAYLGIGDSVRALEWLETAVENPGGGYAWLLAELAHNWLDEPILDQPEFVEVRSRLGFREQ